MSTSFFEKYKAGIIFIAGLFCILLVRVWVIYRLYQSGFVSLTADEFGRPVLAAQWALHPRLLYDGWWLPHFSYIYGLALRIYWNLVWMPRAVSIGFGAATIALLAYITYQLTRNTWYALTSAVLLAANPLHIWFSAVALSEAPSWFFSFAFLSCYLAYMKNRKTGFLYMASAALFVANGLRLETWVISALFLLALLFEGVTQIRRCRSWDAHLTNLVVCGGIALAFPLYWTAASYIVTGNPFATLANVESYKATYYGTQVDFMNYPRAFWNIDPLMALLLPFVIIYGLLQFKKQRNLFLYTLTAAILLAVFIGFHRGRVDPPISYQRYTAFYLYALIPVLVYMTGVVLKRIAPGIRYDEGILLLLILVYAAWHVGLASHFSNDASLPGFRAGQYIKFLRKSDPSFAQKPVLLELQYWDYLAFHIGANDVTQVYYDRALRWVDPNPPSLFFSDPEALKRCISQLKIGALVARSPEVKAAIEKELGIKPFYVVNEYTIYQPPAELYSLPQYRSPKCPLSPGTGY